MVLHWFRRWHQIIHILIARPHAVNGDIAARTVNIIVDIDIGVGTRTTGDLILPVAAGLLTSEKRIIVGSAIHHISASPADEGIIASVALQIIVACTALQLIVSGAAGQGVVARTTG